MSDFKFDILFASYNRVEIFEACLNSFVKNLPSELGHIIVLTQREDAKTAKLVNDLSVSYPIKLIYSEVKLSPGASRNSLVKNSNSDYLCFLDDDTLIPENYFSKAVEVIRDRRPAVFGGPDQSPQGISLAQDCLGQVLEEPFVMGPTFKRHSNQTVENHSSSEVELTLCNLWFRADLFKNDKYSFNETLKRCEENFLLEELNSGGYQFEYYPQMFIYHRRRESLWDLAAIQLKSGHARGKCFHQKKETFKPFFIFPILAGLYLTVLPFVPVKFSIGLILIHTLISFYIALKCTLRLKKPMAFPLSWMMIIIIHICFSLGIFFGTIVDVRNYGSQNS